MTVLLRFSYSIWFPFRYENGAEEDNHRWWRAGDSGRETFGSRLLHPVLIRSIKRLNVETSLVSWYVASNRRQGAT